MTAPAGGEPTDTTDMHSVKISGVASGAESLGGIELIDNTGTYLYEGFAPFGTASSAASWIIIRSTLSAGGISAVERADGNSNADNVWDNRASLSYS